MINFTLTFDARVPDLGTSPEDIYSAALDMSAYADEMGIPIINLMEHHGTKDGYCPSPLVMAAGVAARTKRARLLIGALILPLHDPVKVAEDIAVADIMSNGRIDVVFGAGYVKSEFDMFGRSIKERGKLLDEFIPVVQRALQGERFTWNGREIYVSPRPTQRPYPRLFAGGGVEASAKRAARFDIGFMPMNPAMIPLYKEECARYGRAPRDILTGLSWLHVSDNPEKTRKELGPHLFHYAKSYAEFTGDAASSSPFEGLETMEQIWNSGIVKVVTPEEAAAKAIKVQQFGGNYMLAPLLGGLSPKIGWRSLELLVDKVFPLLGHGKKKTTRGVKAGSSVKSTKPAKGAKKKTPAKKAAAKSKAKVKAKAKAKPKAKGKKRRS
jgi:alkanesulfonate monooxygenase SsuD/methylene tetrahydromethanopterin reductase-like flavin-dependent oxidoreductase (luciferase family)